MTSSSALAGGAPQATTACLASAGPAAPTVKMERVSPQDMAFSSALAGGGLQATTACLASAGPAAPTVKMERASSPNAGLATVAVMDQHTLDEI
eukprot:COSAG05_NODE_2471_length_3023_cov_1.479822_1_plen_93_part_10